MELAELIRRWQALKDQASEAEKLRVKCNNDKDALATIVIDKMVEAGVSSIAVDGRTYYIGGKTSAVKTDEDVSREEIVDALMADGLDHLVPRSFNWNTLHAFVKDLTEEGEPLPEHLAAVIKPSKRDTLGSRAK